MEYLIVDGVVLFLCRRVQIHCMLVLSDLNFDGRRKSNKLLVSFFVFKGPRTLQGFSQRFFHRNRCKNCFPYMKLLKKSLQLWKKVVVRMDNNDFFCSYSCSVRGPLDSKVKSFPFQVISLISSLIIRAIMNQWDKWIIFLIDWVLFHNWSGTGRHCYPFSSWTGLYFSLQLQ